MRFGFVVAAAALSMASPAFAHPRLISATPAADASVAPTATVSLTFSDTLVAASSGADVLMLDMPGMKMHAPMKMTGKAAVAPDGRTLTVTFARPLPRGTYRIAWHVVASDAHPVEGNYAFKVK